MKVKLTHKVVIAIVIPVIFQLGFFWMLLKSVDKIDSLEKIEREAADTLFLRNRICVAEAFVFLYYGLYRVSGNPEFKKKLYENSNLQRSAFQMLNQRWKNDSAKHQILNAEWQQNRFYRMAFQLTLNLPRATSMRDFFGQNPSNAGMAMISHTRGNLDGVFANLEREQAGMLQQAQELESDIKNKILAGLFASLLVTLGAGLLFSKSIASRLRKVVNNIKWMEKPEAELQKVGGNDEIAALNNAIINTNNKIREAEQFQAQTARIVAQELERPLNQINDLMVDMKENGFEELNNNGTDRIERSLLEVARLRSLVKDLVSLDKISRIGWELESSIVDLADIAKTALDTVQDYARKNKVELILRVEETPVLGDPARLQQIALNLLTNAIKFSPHKSVIEIETKIENQFGKLSVTDHGTGIPEEFQQKIFGHFEQVSTTDATEKGGSGLGLAISKRLVESQQGRMGFKSQLGSGSTFWFSLPLSIETPPAVNVPETSQVGLQRLKIRPDRSDKSAAPNSSLSGASFDSTRSHEFRSTLWKKSLVMVFLPLIVQFATIGIMWSVIDSLRNNVNEFNRLSLITSDHAKVMDALIRSQLFAIFYNIDHVESFRYNTDVERGKARDAIDRLREISRSNVDLAKDAESLDKMVQEQFALQDDVINARQDADVNVIFGPNNIEETERKLAQVVVPLGQAIEQEQKLIEKNVLAKNDTRQVVGNIAIALGVCTFLVSVLLGVFMIRSLTARVRKIVENTQRLAVREPLQPPSEEKDEIGFVEHSFFDAANKLTKLEQYKQELIALTSHEFRTPLTSLLAKADLIEVGVFGPLNAHGEKTVVKIKRNISDLIALLTNLLDVEKIQSGKSLVVKEKSDVDDILQRAAKNVSLAVREKEIELRVPDTNIEVNADSGRLVQALTAVLSDVSLHASPASSIQLGAARANGELTLTIKAPGGVCSREALNTSSARGRLAVDLLRLITQQHGGRLEINAGDEQLLVRVNLPAAA